MLTIPSAMESLLMHQTHRFALCWKIEKINGDILRFTTHDTTLTLSDGSDYEPGGGLNPTARRKEAGLKDHNVEFEGVITSDKITFDDMKGGLYNEAVIWEYMVDWKYPFLGNFVSYKGWIVNTSYDGEKWRATLSGINRWTKHSVGELVNRSCKHKEFGDTRCGVNLGGGTPPYTVTGATVTNVTTDRLIFTASGIGGSYSDDYFAWGKITWTSGNNDSLISTCKHWTLTGTIVELVLPTPLTIQNGDTFTIVAGCNRLSSTCDTKFNNLINFGGELFTTGTDKVLQRP